MSNVTGLFLSDREISTTMVSILPVKPATARASRIFILITRLHGVWCTPGFRPWCRTFPSVMRRPTADHWEPWTLPASICWWLTDLWFLSSSGIHGATITHLNVHQSCRWLDAFKSPPTKYSEDWDPLVSYKSSTSPTATSSTPSRYGLRDAVSCSPRPRNLSWLRHVDEFPRQEVIVDLFCCAEAASFHSPFIVQTRGSITGDVTCPQSSGLW